MPTALESIPSRLQAAAVELAYTLGVRANSHVLSPQGSPETTRVSRNDILRCPDKRLHFSKNLWMHISFPASKQHVKNDEFNEGLRSTLSHGRNFRAPGGFATKELETNKVMNKTFKKLTWWGALLTLALSTVVLPNRATAQDDPQYGAEGVHVHSR